MLTPLKPGKVTLTNFRGCGPELDGLESVVIHSAEEGTPVFAKVAGEEPTRLTREDGEAVAKKMLSFDACADAMLSMDETALVTASVEHVTAAPVDGCTAARIVCDHCGAIEDVKLPILYRHFAEAFLAAVNGHRYCGAK